MKSILTIIILFLIGHSSNAQHTNRFLNIVKDLKQVSSETDTIFYKNGNVFWKTCWTTYEYNSENYSCRTGSMVQYYKNGMVANEYCLDNYGNIKSMKEFDRKGNKTLEYVTTEIDSRAKSLPEFFESQDHMNFKTWTSIYRCSNNLGIFYLYKEGSWINQQKNGIWTTYHENGEIKKVKEF